MVSGRDELNGVWEASFADVIDISDEIRAGRRVRRRRVMMRVAALLLLAGAGFVLRCFHWCYSRGRPGAWGMFPMFRPGRLLDGRIREPLTCWPNPARIT